MPSKFKLGAAVTIGVSFLAVIAISVTFISNASPYVDVTQALATSGDALHLLGSIDRPTVHSDAFSREITFDLIDAKGKKMHVNYRGEAISNIDAAEKVVAVGSVKNGVFDANKLYIKCPSKYEDGKGPAKSA